MGRPLDPEIRDRLEAYGRLLEEHEGHNVRYFGDLHNALLKHSACDGKTILNGMRGLRLHCDSRGHIAEFVKWLEETRPWLTRIYSQDGPEDLRIYRDRAQRSNDPDYLFGVAQLNYSQSYFHTATDLLAEAASIYSGKRELQQQAKVLRMHASCATFIGDPQLADQLLSQAIALSKAANDMLGEINGLEGSAFNYFLRGDIAAAKATYDAIQENAEKYDQTCFGCCCYGLGRVLQESAPGQAIEWHRRGIDAFRSNEIGLGNCHYGLGLAFLQGKEWDQAGKELEEAEGLYLGWGNNLGVAACRKKLADLASNKP